MYLASVAKNRIFCKQKENPDLFRDPGKETWELLQVEQENYDLQSVRMVSLGLN
jgi:hypothetical protein